MFGNILTVFCAIFLAGRFTTAYLANNVYEEYYYSKYNGSKVTWMMMPDDNGLVVSAIISGLVPKKKLAVDDVHFHLWTRENPYEPETTSFNNDHSKFLNFININPNRSTVFLIHGFTDTVKKPEFFNTLVKAFLEYDDCNVIGVNWTRLASIPWYGQAVKNTFFVGLLTARAISAVRNLSPSEPSKIHVVAHNLGTLVAGVAGYKLKNSKIERITGLDPAYISTKHLSKKKRLSEEDADVVEIVHTSGNYIGITERAGHRDFYPNGGTWPQPGCLYDIADRCSSRRAFQYYAEALVIKDSFLATRCNNYEDYLAHQCYHRAAINLANKAGSYLLGKFYLTTGSEAPFSDLDD